MTAIQIARRRVSVRLSAMGVEALALSLVMLIAILAAIVAVASTRLQPASAATTDASAPLARSQKVALIDATTGEKAVEVRAIGDQARIINASLPFSSTPVEAARPFLGAGEALDHRRALLCLTQAVYYEAGFEPMTGRRAVAQVVLNRMRHPAFPKSVCGVVYQRNSTPVCQFSFVCDGSLSRAPAAEPWRIAQEIARASLAGYVETSVGSATHYHADYVAPRWAPMLAKVAKLGAHIFYRWPGAWGMPAAFSGRYIGEPSDPSTLRPVMRIASLGNEFGAPGAVVIVGPPIARAENDVGGLLDISKGWTLNIPMPADVSGGAARAIAQQQSRPPGSSTNAVVVAVASAPILAAR